MHLASVKIGLRGVTAAVTERYLLGAMATSGDDEGRSAEHNGEMGGFGEPTLPPPVLPPPAAEDELGSFAPPVVPPPLVATGPPLYSTSMSSSATPIHTLRQPVGSAAGGRPASFEEMRAVHEATTRQLRERREPATGRGAVLAMGLVTMIGAAAILLGALWF